MTKRKDYEDQCFKEDREANRLLGDDFEDVEFEEDEEEQEIH